MVQVNERVDVVSFFESYVMGDLGPDGSSNPMLKADAIRFVRTWRNHLPEDALGAALAAIIPLINHESVVVSTYAAGSVSIFFFFFFFCCWVR